MSAHGQRAATAEPKRNEVLAYLREIYPKGARTHDLVDRFGWCVRTRLAELRADGWNIPEGEWDEVSNEAVYRLASLDQGPPKPKMRTGMKAVINEDRSATIEFMSKGSPDLARALEGEVALELLNAFDADPGEVEIVREAEGRVVTLRLVPQARVPMHPQDDWFTWMAGGVG